MKRRNAAEISYKMVMLKPSIYEGVRGLVLGNETSASSDVR